MKYRVEMGSLVTKFMRRTFTITADSEQEAIEKAEAKFLEACDRQPYTECGGTVNCDFIEKIG